MKQILQSFKTGEMWLAAEVSALLCWAKRLVLDESCYLHCADNTVKAAGDWLLVCMGV